MSKSIITFEVDHNEMFDTVKRVGQVAASEGLFYRLSPLLLSGQTPAFKELIGLAIYGISDVTVTSAKKDKETTS